MARKKPSLPACYAVALGAIALLGLALADRSSAGDLGDEFVGLRIGLALDRASTFTDVIGMSASTAYPYLSSVNPAAGDFLREPPNVFRVIGTGTGAYVAFNNGSSITAGAASVTYRLPNAGTILASYTRVDSQDVESHQGDHFTLRSNEMRLSYSHLLDKWIALGASVKLTQSRLGLSTLFFDFPQHTDTESLGVEGSVSVWLRNSQRGRLWTLPPTSARGSKE